MIVLFLLVFCSHYSWPALHQQFHLCSDLTKVSLAALRVCACSMTTVLSVYTCHPRQRTLCHNGPISRYTCALTCALTCTLSSDRMCATSVSFINLDSLGLDLRSMSSHFQDGDNNVLFFKVITLNHE